MGTKEIDLQINIIFVTADNNLVLFLLNLKQSIRYKICIEM